MKISALVIVLLSVGSGLADLERALCLRWVNPKETGSKGLVNLLFAEVDFSDVKSNDSLKVIEGHLILPKDVENVEKYLAFNLKSTGQSKFAEGHVAYKLFHYTSTVRDFTKCPFNNLKVKNEPVVEELDCFCISMQELVNNLPKGDDFENTTALNYYNEVEDGDRWEETPQDKIIEEKEQINTSLSQNLNKQVTNIDNKHINKQAIHDEIIEDTTNLETERSGIVEPVKSKTTEVVEPVKSKTTEVVEPVKITEKEIINNKDMILEDQVEETPVVEEDNPTKAAIQIITCDQFRGVGEKIVNLSNEQAQYLTDDQLNCLTGVQAALLLLRNKLGERKYYLNKNQLTSLKKEIIEKLIYADKLSFNQYQELKGAQITAVPAKMMVRILNKQLIDMKLRDFKNFYFQQLRNLSVEQVKALETCAIEDREKLIFMKETLENKDLDDGPEFNVKYAYDEIIKENCAQGREYKMDDED